MTAQGQWLPGFDHAASGASVHPASASIATPNYWITENTVGATGLPTNVPGQRMQPVHTCLIPSGPFRGCLLVWDGNLTLVGTRSYQPWAIVDPYYPAANPFVAGGGSGYRFHNGLLNMQPALPNPQPQQQGTTGPGELFCAGQRWAANGRLVVAGGTRQYPLVAGTALPNVNTGSAGWWEGARFLYQWDPTTIPGSDPFGKWYPMPPLEAERWYPTVTADGGTQNRFLILGGTDILASGAFDVVNTYESVRINFLTFPPALAAIEQKLGTPPPPPTARQYSDTTSTAILTDYPRVHALGVLDPISTGTAPRLFVSGFVGQGIRWAHDPDVNPTYSFNVGTEAVPSVVSYSTNLLLPGAVGSVPNRILRIGGERATAASVVNTNRVESIDATIPGTITNEWSSGTDSDIPDMIFNRKHGNVVMLPTGDLLAVGGDNSPGSFNLTPELYRFASGDWKGQAAHGSPRNYHSCAVLLPDARVLVCGGEARTTDYQIWVPQYLIGTANRRPAGVSVFDSTTSAAIDDEAMPGATYGQQCRIAWTNTLPAGVTVSQIVLIAPAALTHHDDGGQRLVRLALLYTDDAIPGSIHFLMPASYRHAPPGWYMLFAITNEGVPADAFWINLG